MLFFVSFFQGFTDNIKVFQGFSKVFPRFYYFLRFFQGFPRFYYFFSIFIVCF